MADPSRMGAEESIEGALTALVMDCPELAKLEGRLSRFNIFRVLKAAKHEIRHSNMLAWLFDPEESHGLGDRFLRRWLMNVARDALVRLDSPGTFPSPIEIDAVDIEYVEVFRELEKIDLLVEIKTGDGKTWIICIENKIESSQHGSQLSRYRNYVEQRYIDATYRLYVFLTRFEEEPEEAVFITSSHEVIESVLRLCLKERRAAIGAEPRLLIEQYLDLLAEDFVDDSKSAQLARQIYRRHKKAIDFILEVRADPISVASDSLKELLTSESPKLGIAMAPCGKGRVRFIPRQWDVPENSGGTAWGTNSRYVLCEVIFWSKTVELHICVGKAPDVWADAVWNRAATPPFKQEWRRRPRHWVKPYKAKSNIRIKDLADTDGEEVGRQVFDWLQGELQIERFKNAVAEMSGLLSELRKD